MSDFLKAGLVYVPAYFLGHSLADRYGEYAFLIGWLSASSAVMIRRAQLYSMSKAEEA